MLPSKVEGVLPSHPQPYHIKKRVFLCSCFAILYSTPPEIQGGIIMFTLFHKNCQRIPLNLFGSRSFFFGLPSFFPCALTLNQSLFIHKAPNVLSAKLSGFQRISISFVIFLFKFYNAHTFIFPFIFKNSPQNIGCLRTT